MTATGIDVTASSLTTYDTGKSVSFNTTTNAHSDKCSGRM